MTEAIFLYIFANEEESKKTIERIKLNQSGKYVSIIKENSHIQYLLRHNSKNIVINSVPCFIISSKTDKNVIVLSESNSDMNIFFRLINE